MTPHFLKRTLLLFWAVWLSVVTSTNACDGLKELGWLPAGWLYASGNFAFVAGTTARYGVPGWLNAVLFLGVVLWEALAAVLFWLAWRGSATMPAPQAGACYPAFVVSLMLWCAFMLADEVLITYAVEATHTRLFIAQLATLLVLVLVPEGQPTDKP